MRLLLHHLLRSLPYLPLRPNGAPPAQGLPSPDTAHQHPHLDKRLADAAPNATNSTSLAYPTGTSFFPFPTSPPLSILLPSPSNLSLSSSSTTTTTTTPTTLPFLTLITPSPFAPAIPITSQSQLITSFVPVLTACPLSASGSPPLFGKKMKAKRDPQAFGSFPRPIPPIVSGGPLISTNYSLPAAATGLSAAASLSGASGVLTRVSSGTAPASSGFPVRNASASAYSILSSSNLCSTSYSPTITPVCHTTLTPLGGVPILVSACDQHVAFSTGLGIYTSSAAAGGGNGSAVEVLLPTTYSAPWDSVVTGVPFAPVVGVYCPVDQSVCSTVTESWYKEVVGAVGSTTSGVSVSAVMTGPSEIFIPPLIQTSIPAGVITTIAIDTTYTLAFSTSLTAVVQETYSPSTTTTVTSTSTSVKTVTLAAGDPVPKVGA